MSISQGWMEMIIQEMENEYYMIKQEDHAVLSGVFASMLTTDSEILSACETHDRAWRELDEVPVWNDLAEAPYSFLNYPVAVKLIHYRHGIDEIEKQSTYAALLHSLHYTKLTGQERETEKWFHDEELRRQERLQQLQPQKEPEKDTALLRLVDSLSLFFCMHLPGEKSYENAAQGLEPLASVRPEFREELTGTWTAEDTFQFHPALFKQTFDIHVPVYIVSKEKARNHGLAGAWKQSQPENRVIRIRGGK
ncbi:DUF3891 family protein [Alkalicoccus urumqiensis]|nr:DUF3891 family protein [Alkalicoccus urumqiensis]